MEWVNAAGWQRRARRQASQVPGQGGEPEANPAAADTLRALRVGVLVLDSTDQPVLANPAAYDLGLIRAGGDCPQVHAVVRTLADRVRRGAEHQELEMDMPRGGESSRGEPLGVRIRISPLGGPGYPSGHVAIEATDVTEAHRVARVRRDFVANVSHELKTPVGALALLAETLLEATDDPAAARRFAERINHESQRLARLVKELLELSRLQGAEPLPSRVPVAMDRIISEVLDRTRMQATAKNIDVSLSGTRGVTVYGDEGQLVTAVANLVENAVAYSPDDTLVTIETHREGEMVAASVADQGIGIRAKDLDRIFERFYRADHARSRETGGTGLGLAIVRHIAVNHGGRVDVVSTLGQGSTFTLWLPAQPYDPPNWVGASDGEEERDSRE